MLWGLVDTFVDELIACYGSRDQAERALLDVLPQHLQGTAHDRVVLDGPRLLLSHGVTPRTAGPASAARGHGAVAP